jgi:hypothetical protein
LLAQFEQAFAKSGTGVVFAGNREREELLHNWPQR